MALKRNIRLAEIRAILADYGLDWDTERLDLRTNAAQMSMTSTNQLPRPELAELSGISLPQTGEVSLRVKRDRRGRPERSRGSAPPWRLRKRYKSQSGRMSSGASTPPGGRP